MALLDQSHSVLWGPESEQEPQRLVAVCGQGTSGATLRDVLPPSSSEASKTIEIQRFCTSFKSVVPPSLPFVLCHSAIFIICIQRSLPDPQGQGNITTRGRVGSWLALQVPVKRHHPCWRIQEFGMFGLAWPLIDPLRHSFADWVLRSRKAPAFRSAMTSADRPFCLPKHVQLSLSHV